MFDELVNDLLSLTPEGLSLFSAYISALENQDMPALPSAHQVADS